MSTVFCCLQINTPKKIFALKQNKYCAIQCVMWFIKVSSLQSTHENVCLPLCRMEDHCHCLCSERSLLRWLLTVDNFDWELFSSHFPCFWSWTLLCSAGTEYCKHVWSGTTGSQQVLCRVPSVSQYYGQLFTADLGPVSAPSPSPASRLPPLSPSASFLNIDHDLSSFSE